jgi:hypothetical protein
MQSLKHRLHRTLSAVLAVWLSGFVFLLCCHITPVEAADYCPLAKLGAHCDKAEKEKNSDKLTSSGDEQEVNCCAFLPAFFDKTRIVDDQQTAVGTLPAEPQSQRLVVTSTVSSLFTPYQPVVLVRNDTFLKNRAFRI